MTAQIQLPVSAVLSDTAWDTLPVEPRYTGSLGDEPSEFDLHLLAMEIVRHSPMTAQKVALAGMSKIGGA